MPPLTLFYAGGVTALLSPSPAGPPLPMKHLLPKAAQTPPRQQANPSGQRVLEETKRLHQAKQKNPQKRGNETLRPALWETQCQKPA